jgi:hypothetical protein
MAMQVPGGQLNPESKEAKDLEYQELKRKMSEKSIIPDSVLTKRQDQQALEKLVSEGKVSPEVLGNTQPVTQEPARSVATTQTAPSFVSQNTQSANNESSASLPINMINSGMNLYGQGMVEQGVAQSQGSAQQAKLYGDFIASEEKLLQEQQKVEKEREQKIAEFEAEYQKAFQAQKNAPKIEGDFWKNKSTGQKIMFGIGAFLGSLTQQGAQNVAKIIDTEIDRDIEQQKLAYEKLGNNTINTYNAYRQFYEKFKDEKIARSAAKVQRYDQLNLKLQQLAANTQSKVALGKTKEAVGQVEMGRAKEIATIYERLGKSSVGAVPGYKGTIKDEVSARDFKKQVAAQNAAKVEIDNLLTINNKFLGGALSTDARASAKQSQTLLIGQLREVLTGPGSVSDGERALMAEAIANPTEFLTLKSSNKIKLEKLKTAIANKVKANAVAYGLEPDGPTAREIQ